MYAKRHACTKAKITAIKVARELLQPLIVATYIQVAIIARL
jgi:hypothetical protein